MLKYRHVEFGNVVTVTNINFEIVETEDEKNQTIHYKRHYFDKYFNPIVDESTQLFKNKDSGKIVFILSEDNGLLHVQYLQSGYKNWYRIIDFKRLFELEA